jgi:hypothetical protein
MIFGYSLSRVLLLNQNKVGEQAIRSGIELKVFCKKSNG